MTNQQRMTRARVRYHRTQIEKEHDERVAAETEAWQKRFRALKAELARVREEESVSD